MVDREPGVFFGTPFLIFYGVVAVGLLGASVRWHRWLSAAFARARPHEEPADRYELAALAGGHRGVVMTAVTFLQLRGLAEIVPEPNGGIRRLATPDGVLPAALHPFERRLLEVLDRERPLRLEALHTELVLELNGLLVAVEKRGLLLSPAELQRLDQALARPRRLALCAPILGAVNVFLRLAGGHDAVGLLFLVAGSAIASWLLLPGTRGASLVTDHGQNFLEARRRQLRERLADGQAASLDELLERVAVLGVSSLAGTEHAQLAVQLSTMQAGVPGYSTGTPRPPSSVSCGGGVYSDRASASEGCGCGG